MTSMRVTATLLLLAACGPFPDFNMSSDGSSSSDAPAEVEASSGSTGLDGSEATGSTGLGTTGSSTDAGSSSDTGSSSSSSSGGTTGEPCVVEDGQCLCDGQLEDPEVCGCGVADGVCKCDGALVDISVCLFVCQAVDGECLCDGIPAGNPGLCGIPDPACDVGYYGNGQWCLCDGFPADPSGCGCSFDGAGDCVCDGVVQGDAICEGTPLCVPGLPCWCDDAACPVATNPLDASCSCYIKDGDCHCPSGTLPAASCQLC